MIAVRKEPFRYVYEGSCYTGLGKISTLAWEVTTCYVKRVHSYLLISNMCGIYEYILQIMSYLGKQVSNVIVALCEFSDLKNEIHY